MFGPLDVHRHLLSRDIPHEIVRLRRVAPTADHLPDVLGLPAFRCVIARVYTAYAGSTPFLAVVLCPADLEPDLRVLRDLLGTTNIDVAVADVVNAQTGYFAGHVAPLLLPEDAVICVAEEITRHRDEVVYTTTGDGGTVLAIHASDLLDLCGARFVVPAKTAVPTPTAETPSVTPAVRPAVTPTLPIGLI